MNILKAGQTEQQRNDAVINDMCGIWDCQHCGQRMQFYPADITRYFSDMGRMDDGTAFLKSNFRDSNPTDVPCCGKVGYLKFNPFRTLLTKLPGGIDPAHQLVAILMLVAIGLTIQNQPVVAALIVVAFITTATISRRNP